MTMFNTAQWTGNYRAERITEIRAHVKNDGPVAQLELRIIFRASTQFSNTGFISKIPIIVPNDGVWREVVFPIDKPHLEPILGETNTYSDTMSDVGLVRIISSTTPKWRGDAIAATLGIDNIEATHTPPPPLLAMVGLPDINADSVPDLIVVREGSIVAEVRDGANGALLRNITFLDDGFTPITAAALPDSDGNGVAEIAVLASRDSDGRFVVEMRNAAGDQLPRQVWFAAGHTAITMAVIASDADNNGIPELAVLKTFGFTDLSVSLLVMSESVLLCVVGGVLGIGLAVLVSSAIGPQVVAFFGTFKLEWSTIWAGLGIAVLLGVVVGLVPAIGARRLQIADALRK